MASITQLIDEKISDDMEKVIMTMRNEFSLLNSKFEHIDGKFGHVENKIATVYWVIGIAGTVLTVVIGLLALKN